ncbi:AAA family ATPase [Actinomyces dentalis]|uniref:AAA family ATPase n=1 Tax=Actinomyces dentalis TaxID=272548 RepID=UPI0028E3C103|nr:AAA family ATPase [Actinomyces dentalis]
MSMPTTPSSRGASGGGVVPDGAHRATAASAAPTTRVPTGPYAPARSHGFVGASASSAPRASATSAASAASAPRAATAPRRTGSARRAASPYRGAPPYQAASPQTPYQDGAPQTPYQTSAPQTPYQAASPQTPAPLARALVESIESVVVGKREAVETTVATFLAGGHLLVEDVPGVGKTTLALALARCLELTASRIQFTADLLPADVTGVSVYDQSTRTFRFHPGPIFAGVVVADEINRATARTQSALLEAMGEGHVSVEGDTRPLPDPFMVVATQNPLDMEGTYRLPEAQRDRFMTRLTMGYPEPEEEAAMLLARGGADPLDALRPVATQDEAQRARRTVAGLHVDPAVARYAVELVAATRRDPALLLGASPRAGLQLLAHARARAAMDGRGFVSPDDVARAAPAVLTHRLIPAERHVSPARTHEAAAQALARVVSATAVPGRR